MSLKNLNALIEEIEGTEDRMLRSEILIDLAKAYAEVPASVASRPFPDDHKAPACQSDAFVWVEKGQNGLLTPYFAVENPQGLSAKALASVLSQNCSDLSIEEMLAIDEEVVPRIFGATISMGKGEGLKGMIRKMKLLAGRTVK